MSEFKISQIAKKPLKVAVNNVVNTPPVAAPVSIVSQNQEEEIVNDIQASKPIKLTKKGKPDTRGGNLDNLAKGRIKLQESWDAKRALKEQMTEAALQKKMKLAAKQKKIIEQSFGVEDVATDDEIEEELIQKQIIATKPLTSKKNKVAPPPPPPPPKKKVIKYVEVETSSEEEEEEIVYVKRQKAPAAPAPKPVAKPVAKQRNNPVVNNPPYPQIVFY